jgi:DNA-binding MarR family transcriptional regulator
MSTSREISEKEVEEYSFVLQSKYRTDVVLILSYAEIPLPPSAIVGKSGESRSTISRAISELRDENLVELLVDESRRKGRLYGLTERGERIAPHVQEAVDDE